MSVSDQTAKMSEILLSYMKAGPMPGKQASDAFDAAIDGTIQAIVSVSDVTSRYAETCQKFMAATISSQSVPLRGIASSSEASTRDARGATIFGASLTEKIQDRYRFCLDNFEKQAQKYFDEEVGAFRREVSEFLAKIPVGGSKDKEVKAQISSIKKAAKSLNKWHEYIFMHKATSFQSEIEFIQALDGGAVIAVVWRYSPLDEQCDIPREHDHRNLERKVFLVRDSWAMNKGYINEKGASFIEDVTRPQQDVGCMCYLVWLHNLRDLPEHLLSDSGREALERTRVR